MSWLQVQVFSEKDDCDAITDFLNELGAEAVTLRDNSDSPIFEPPLGTTPLWQQVKITGLFPDSTDQSRLKAALTEQLQSHQLSAGLSIEKLEDEQWERTWIDKFQPMCFGDKLWICPSWTPPPDPDGLNILMDPGLAFGSGSHPTTAMCLNWLAKQDLSDLAVLDYGCGSGILSIAASLLDAKKVWAVDLDPQAIIATKNNALHNKRDNIVVSLPHQLPNISADLIVANILAQPLCQLADIFWEASHVETEILLSGVLASQFDELAQAYSGKFHLSVVENQEEWLLIHGFCSKNTL